ncbi:MAG: hemerythrin domain-containing protein [Austwickia sp.]|nr:hemerythrin domain-containing protein [Austwickia sp.]
MSLPALPRPTSGDICQLILQDHRTLESLLSDLRVAVQDREATRAAFAALLMAHSEGEEQAVYPSLTRTTPEVGQDEVSHGREEHAEGVAALLELLECKGVETAKFEKALEKVSAYVTHHLAEEELTILGPALTSVPEKKRREIGSQWLAARGELLDADCGSIEYVRASVEKARAEDLIPADLPDQPED